MYDLIVAGAGPAGCMLAQRVASKGHSVLIVDKKERNEIGHRWIDDIEKTVFSETGLAKPRKEEMFFTYSDYSVLSPSGRREIRLGSNHTVAVKMDKFVNRLLESAIEAGAEFVGGTAVDQALLDNRKIRGVITEDGKEIPSVIVADATGWKAVLRTGLESSSVVSRDKHEDCMVTAWREQRTFSENDFRNALKVLGMKPDCCKSRVGFKGGYSVLLQCLNSENRMLDILVGYNTGVSKESAGDFVRRYLSELNIEGETVYGGGGMIPVRRSIDCLVDDNFVVLGDAACMVIPAHGSGVASGIIAGQLAAKVLSKCLNNEDTGIAALWEYNASYQRERGALLAYFDVVRMLTRKMDEDDMEKLVGYAMTSSDVESGMIPKTLRLSFDDAKKRWRGLRHPAFLAKFAALSALSLKMKKVYEKYPPSYNISELAKWKSEVESIVKKLS